MRKILTLLIMGLLLFGGAVAQEDGHASEIEEGRILVDSKADCDTLSDDQLEAVGEYYMELMHPGPLHDAMHYMMGLEEGTEQHDQFHINMAKRMYCGEYAGYGMMGSGGMMGYGGGYSMMNWAWTPTTWWTWSSMMFVAFAALIFAVVFWGVYTLTRTKRR